MSETLRSLRENLQDQVDLYTELNRLAHLKQSALINNELQELEVVTVREEQLLLKAGQLEKARLVWAEQIGQKMGKAPEELTLNELAEHYPELEGVRADLDKILHELQQVHEVNTQLLQQALKVVDFTMNLLTQEEKPTYARPGQKPQSDKGRVRLVDRTV